MLVLFVIILILAAVLFAGVAKSSKSAASVSRVSGVSSKPTPPPDGDVRTSTEPTPRYDSMGIRYVDSKANIERVKALAVTLALAVSAADGYIRGTELALIRDWARETIGGEGNESDKTEARRKVDKAIHRAAKLFRCGSRIDVYRICKEIAQIASISQRYNILNLCLHVAKADGVATAQELELLTKFSRWLTVDEDRFRAMMEKVLPVSMHEVKDMEFVLGVRPDMSKEKARKCLNKEYRKWNARATHFNPEIQGQADDMLKLISETRKEYIG